MNVNGIGSPTTTGAVGSPPSNELGQDQFLQLLLVQMQNQSPLDPMDSQQFLAQLAQFTTIEQLVGVNDGIDNLAIGQAGMVAGQVVTMIGKDVTYEGNQVQLVDGEGDLKFELAQGAASVTVEIRNAEGVVVRVLELGKHGPGVNDHTWDGTDNSGAALRPGTYTYEVKALTADDKAIKNTTFSTGRVDGVTYASGSPELIIGDVKVHPANILSITEPQENEES